MDERVCFTFRGRLATDSFAAFVRHRAARLDLRVDIGAAGTDRCEVTVAGNGILIDAFEMACSLGPLDCMVLEIDRLTLA